MPVIPFRAQFPHVYIYIVLKIERLQNTIHLPPMKDHQTPHKVSVCARSAENRNARFKDLPSKKCNKALHNP